MTKQLQFLNNDSKEEAEYLTKNSIILKKLPNSSRLLCSTRIISDTMYTTFRFHFLEGSLADPAGQEGIHHLTEHLINKTIHTMATENDVSLNADTTFYKVSSHASGFSHPQVIGYGIWPMLPILREVLEDPLKHISNLKEVVESEKKVVLAEIAEYEASHYQQVYRIFRKLAFTPDNPMLNEPLGTEESVNSLQVSDIEKLASDLFTSQNLLIDCFIEGTSTITETMLTKIENLFTNFPGQKNTNRADSWKLLNKLNGEFTQGKIFKKDTALQTNLVSLFFSWECKFEPFSTSYFALQRLRNFLETEWFLLLRKHGLSYVSQINLIGSGDSVCFFTLTLTVSTKVYNDTLTDRVSILIQELFAGITDNVIQTICKKEHERQKAILLATADRHDWALRGLIRYGKIINADSIKKTYSTIQEKDFIYWKRLLLASKPVISIIGDLRNL